MLILFEVQRQTLNIHELVTVVRIIIYQTAPDSPFYCVSWQSVLCTAYISPKGLSSLHVLSKAVLYTVH